MLLVGGVTVACSACENQVLHYVSYTVQFIVLCEITELIVLFYISV